MVRLRQPGDLAASGRPGPITGGLFLEDDVADARRRASSSFPITISWWSPAAGSTWTHARSGAALSATIRYESGTPLERSDEDEAELAERPGAELVDFDSGRVAPRTIVSILADVPFWKSGRRSASIRASVLNLFDARYAYNFGNPFSGTHFGAPRTFSVDSAADFLTSHG